MKSRLQETVAALEESGTRYLIVGGVAVVLHGHLRTTLDLDIVIDFEPGNLTRGLQALERLGYQPRAPVPLQAFADQTNRDTWVREKNMVVFSLWHPDDPSFVVDIFVEQPFDFESVYRRAVVVSLPESRAAVISIQDLIQMKQDAGRPKDIDDVRALQRLLEHE